MPSDLDRWERVKRLGGGGQGEVFLCRTPNRVAARAQAKAQIRLCVKNIDGYEGKPSDEFVQSLLQAIDEFNRPDAANEHGALKRFKIPPDDKEEELKAVGRLESEVHVLEKLSHPAVLKLLHSNVAERFVVTEYHRHGTLADNLSRYQGNPLAALQAFKSLVEGVCEIHRQGAIHRDIKPENIFMTSSGGLVLGDFGIVFFQDDRRLTTTFERVGSHFWMAPWAYDNVRLHFNEIKPALDIYSLGKVLWSMISGRNGFPFWEYAEEANNLERLSPDDPSMSLVNELLAKCVVRHAKDFRLSSALDLASEVDRLIDKIKARVRFKADGAHTWPCRVCGKGSYKVSGLAHQVEAYRYGGPVTKQTVHLNVSVCDHCDHAELFEERSQ